MDPKDYFRVHKIALKILGLWPITCGSSSKIVNVFYRIYTAALLLPFCVAFNLTEFLGLFLIYDDIQAFALDLCYFTAHFVTCLRVVLLLARTPRIRNICERMESGILQPDAERGDEEARVLETAVRKSIGYLKVYYFLGLVCILNPLIAPGYRGNESRNSSHVSASLPYYTYVPCDVGDSPCYEIAYVYQIISAAISTIVIIHCDNLYVALALHCCAQFRILGDSLESLRRRASRRVSPEGGSAEIDFQTLRLVANCVQHHHAILEVTEELEGIFSLLILIQFFTHLIQLCFQMFLATEISMLSFDGITLVGFAAAMLLELWIFCQCGNDIMIESAKVSQAAYNADWTSASTPVKRTLLLMMLRAQRPIQFTVGKFAKVSLTTLLSVIRGSVSYFMVLRKMQQ